MPMTIPTSPPQPPVLSPDMSAGVGEPEKASTRGPVAVSDGTATVNLGGLGVEQGASVMDQDPPVFLSAPDAAFGTTASQVTRFWFLVCFRESS